MPSFAVASAIAQAISAQEQQAIIYVGENTFVYGASEVSNAKIVKIAGNYPIKKRSAVQRNHGQKDKLIQKTTDSREKELKILQQKISKRITGQFYTASRESDFIRFRLTKVCCDATANSFSFKYDKAVLQAQDILSIFQQQLTAPKIFHSFIDFILGNYINSFLRGPPLLSLI